MSILKIKDTRKNSADPQLSDDPFEMFTLENYDPPRPKIGRRGDNLMTNSRPAEFSPAEFTSTPNKTAIVPKTLLRRWAILTLSAAVALCAGAVTWHIVQPESAEAAKPYAYFEVRIIDGNGHPVAGAQIRNGGQKIGTTDSFGEWRRYMKVTLGSTVSLGISKKTPKENLAAIKNFAVPAVLPHEGDLGIKGTVQIMREAEFLAANDISEVKGHKSPKDGTDAVVDANASAPAPDEIIADSNKSTISHKEVAPAVPLVSGNEPMVKPDMAAEFPPAYSFNKIAIAVDPGSSHNQAALEVVEAMRKRAEELGLRLDSDAGWKVTIHSLVDRPKTISSPVSATSQSPNGATSGGLFIVRSEVNATPSGRTSFLRNFEADARISARGALWILSMHVQKDFSVSGRDGAWTVLESDSARNLFPLVPGKTLISATGRIFTVSSEAILNGANKTYVLNPPDSKPCADRQSACSLYSPALSAVPPIASWQRLQMRTVGLTRPNTEIFVSGYAATHVGRGVWEYWGAAGGVANVTVVVDGKLSHRTKIATKSGAGVQLMVPAMSLSRR